VRRFLIPGLRTRRALYLLVQDDEAGYSAGRVDAVEILTIGYLVSWPTGARLETGLRSL
jgi:hypothetical protein